MGTSNEFSELRKIGAGEFGARERLASHLASSDAGNQGIPTSAETEELCRGFVDARARTKELIVNYVNSCERCNTDRSRRREAMIERQQVLSELSASVSRLALLLRALGEPPERALILIKTAFSEAAPRQDDDNRAVLEDIVKWVVDAYYAA